MNILGAKRSLEDIVIELGEDTEQLLRFAYELRKFDKEDEYTMDLLYGNIQPQVLLQIIKANRWNKSESKMEYSGENSAFRV